MRPSPDGSRRHSFQNFLHPDSSSQASTKMSSAPTNSGNVSNFTPLQKSTSRTRLNLLNPMNLLARRRSAQGAPAAKATSKESRIAVGYEGIRGTKVHDFSAPRPKPQTVESQPIFSTHTNVVTGGRDEGDAGHGAHTPVFKEDFEDGQSLFPAAGPHVRKPSDFSDLVAPMPAYAKNMELPAKARSQPEPETGTLAPPQQPPAASLPQEKAQRPGLEERTLSYDRSESEEVSRIPTGSLEIGSKKKSLIDAKSGRPRNVSNASLKNFSSMKHMKSNSSRFSFDMIGAATQEKLLEDRHREKVAERQVQPQSNDPYDEEDENGFDYDDMMDDDGMEERIPGVNADLDEEDDDDGEFNPNVLPQQELDGFTFHPMDTSTLNSPISPQGPPQPTPRDSRGDVIGAALTMSPELPNPNSLQQQSQILNPEDSDEEYSDLVPKSIEADLEEEETTELSPDALLQQQQQPQQQQQQQWQPQPLPSQGRNFDADDDMYFDDGTFGFSDDGEEPIPYAGGGDFDESVFDNNDTDEYGRPIKGFDSSIPTTVYSPPGMTDEASRRESEEVKLAKAEKEMATFAEGMSAFGLAGNLQPQSSINHGAIKGQLQPTMSLTQDTLNAHLQALAAHTQAALSSGRFRRDSDEAGHGVIGNTQYQPQYQFNTDNALADDFEDAIEDDFDYNDEFDEDDLIASANAEALANDAGFYAQEFGFYSQPAMNAQADAAVYSNGGYFGPSGAGAITINRSKSGRVLEPNLTPITERSEYSNRNSIMSLPQLASQHGGSVMGSPGGLGPNMGLAQIAGMLREEDTEDDMSMGALLRLRNKKWGGSQNSLSLGSPTPDHSRLSASSPSMGMGQGQTQGPNAFFSPPPRDEGASSPQWTHTPWQQPQQIMSSSPEMTMLEMQREAYGLGMHQHKSRHNRKGSAFSLHSESEHVEHMQQSAQATYGDNISPTLTFSPPTPAERPGMHTQYTERSIHSEYYLNQPVRPHIQSQQHSSETITQQQAISPTAATRPTNDIPAPSTQLRHSLDLRPQSPTHNLASAIGLVSPSVQTFDSEVNFFHSKKGKAASTQEEPRKHEETRKHKHTGSSESVSYTKVLASPEDSPDGKDRWAGGEKWVLERRRTDELGKLEVEREVVEGGRI